MQFETGLSSSFDVTWTNGTTPRGGFFTASMEQLSVGNFVVNNYYAADTADVDTAPLTLVGRLPVVPGTGIFGSGTVLPTSPTTVASKLISAWASAAVQLCGCGVVSNSTVTLNPFGTAGLVSAIGFAVVATSNDAVSMLVARLNTRSFSTFYLSDAPINILPGTGLAVPIQNVIESSGASIPDVDIAINNGSAIFSLMSQSFTFPEE